MGFPTGGTGTSAPLPTGAATAAKQDTGKASLSSIDSKLTSPVAVEIKGHLANGVVNELIRATPFGALHTSIVDPLSCAGQLHVAEPTPRVEYATPSAVTMSGGRTVAAFPVSQQSSDPLYLKNIRLEPGDVLAVGLRTASSTATAELGIDWDED